MAVGHQRHYSILYDNAVEQIRQGLIGDIHHIRAQWHRGNLPGNDSWKPPLPGNEKLTGEISWPKNSRLGKGRGDAQGRSEASGNRRMENEDRAEESADQRHHGRARGEVRLPGEELSTAEPKPRPAARRADPLAAVESHRRRPDGRAGQPSARCVQHLHLGAEIRDGPQKRTCIRSPSPRSAAGRSSRPIATARTTSTACSNSPARATTRTATRTKWPTRTRRSSSPIRRSTATASAATARSCSAPRAR